MTKREQKEKQALRTKLFDMAAGAAGRSDNCLTSEGYAIDLAILSRFMMATRCLFRDLREPPLNDNPWECWNLECWETLDKVTDLLWNYGARA